MTGPVKLKDIIEGLAFQAAEEDEALDDFLEWQRDAIRSARGVMDWHFVLKVMHTVL